MHFVIYVVLTCCFVYEIFLLLLKISSCFPTPSSRSLVSSFSSRELKWSFLEICHRLSKPGNLIFFFFLKFPGPIPWSHAWKSFLPPLPDVKEFHLLPTFPIHCEKLLGRQLSIPKWLKVELLYLFGLSHIKLDTRISLGNALFLSFCL